MEGFAIVFGYVLGLATAVLLGTMVKASQERQSRNANGCEDHDSGVEREDWLMDPDWWKR